MSKPLDNFAFEYQYEPAPDAEERLTQVWDLIIDLILEEFQSEQDPQPKPDGEKC